MRKKGLSILIIYFLILFVPIYGTEINTKQLLENQMEIFNWEAIQEVEDRLANTGGHTSDFSLMDEVKHFIAGDKVFSIQYIGEWAVEAILDEIGVYTHLFARFVLIVVMCSLLQTLSKSFKSKETTKVAFLVCYLVVIFMVVQTLTDVIALSHETIDYLSDVLSVTLPSLLAFMSISGYITSSSVLATVIIGGINMVTFLMQQIILPTVTGIVLLQIVGTMGSDIKVDKFVKLFYKWVKAILKAILVTSIGLMSMYRLTLPYFDMAGKRLAVSVTSSFIPVIGDVGQGAVEFLMSSAQLVKNSFAMGVIVWILIVVSQPLIKLVAYGVIYHVTGAAIQPLGDKKMSDIASILASGCEFVLSCTSIVVVLALIAMVICASVGASIT